MPDIFRFTRLWTWGVVALAAGFIAVSGWMIVSATSCLDEVAANAAMIRQIKQLEEPVQRLDAVAAARETGGWTALMSTFRSRRDALASQHAGDPLVDTHLRTTDSLVERLSGLRDRLAAEATGSPPWQATLLQFREMQSQATGTTDVAVFEVRARMSELSTALRRSWSWLIGLLVVSCVATISQAIIVVIHRRTIRERDDATTARRASDRRQRLILEQLPTVLWTTDNDLRFTSSLGAGLDGLELKPDEVVGMTLFEFFGVDDPALEPIAMHFRALEGESVRYQTRWAGCVFDVHLEPLRESDRRILGTIGLALDVTERESAAAELEQSRNRLGRLLEATAAVQGATTIDDALQVVADAVRDAGWGAVAVYAFDEWRITHRGFAGFTPEQIERIGANEATAARRRELFTGGLEPYRMSRSFFVPADAVADAMPDRVFLPGRQSGETEDAWHRDDLMTVPMHGADDAIIGQISLDDPVDGRRPTPETVRFVEFFAGLAARAVEKLRLLEERRVAQEESTRRGELERLLLRELDHRVRNNLASLVTLIDLGQSTSTDVATFADSVRGRIQAIAGVHRVLSQSRWQSVDLAGLIDEMLPPDCRGRVQASGGEVEIPPRQATAMAMVVHELITNSRKYGALTTEHGRVVLSWTGGEGDERGRQVLWSWRETGGPAVAPSPMPGVGTDLIRGLVRSELHGSLSLNYPAAGAFHQFTCRLDGPEQEAAVPCDEALVASA